MMPVWLSGREAAEYLGVSWPTMRQLILDHQIPHIKIGPRGPWKINTSTLDEHLRHIAELQAGAA